MKEYYIMIWNDIKLIEDQKEHVTKFIFTKDNAVAEAVLYRYPTYLERTVICCSTQSGCPVGCRFCGAGDSFVRSLTTEEIISQAKHCLDNTNETPSDINKLQIMFMSMGEPLLNLKNLIPAIVWLNMTYSQAALLISTSAPAVDYNPVYEISKLIPTVGLQFSIHESTDEARDKLIPFKNKLTLKEIAQRGIEWNKHTNRKPYFNYCAHDKNTTDEDIKRLINLFDPEIWCATISVICERSEGIAASNERQRNLAIDFGNKLVQYGYNVRVFDPAGQDTIGGGCGQLWFVQKWMKDNADKTKPTIGTGKEIVHTPI